MQIVLQCLLIIAWLVSHTSVVADELLAIEPRKTPQGGVLQLRFSESAMRAVKTFALQNPSRWVLDLPGIETHLPSEQQLGAFAGLQSYQLFSDADKTRLVLHHDAKLRFSVTQTKTQLQIHALSIQPDASQTIDGVDFNSLGQRKGQLVIKTDGGMQISQQGLQLRLVFPHTQVPTQWRQRLDVTAFNTPMQQVRVMPQGDGALITATMQEDFDYFAYQVDHRWMVEVTPVTASKSRHGGVTKYTGKHITLNFQNVQVRSVLQMLAEFTQLNIIVSDTVTGSMTLRLQAIPWDQALDIILKTRGLAKRDLGNVLMIAPSQEVAAREAADLKIQQESQALQPLRSELITINYAKADDITKILKEKNSSLLSNRGNVSVDKRSNKIWVRETADRIEEIRALIQDLDVPSKQVLIEARIVSLSDTAGDELGIRFGVSQGKHLSGSLRGASQRANGQPTSAIPFADRLNVNLPTAGDVKGTLGLALAKLGGGFLLDLELSALESVDQVNILSNPRVITDDRYPAVIESGEELPFNESTSSGAAAIAFKKAVLKLEVTPHITPDNRVIMTLAIHNDQRGDQVTGTNQFAINTNLITTQVLVDNGETVVLGGIYKKTKTEGQTRVPFFSQFPLLGRLFKQDKHEVKKQELVIFITPRIMPMKPS